MAAYSILKTSEWDPCLSGERDAAIPVATKETAMAFLNEAVLMERAMERQYTQQCRLASASGEEEIAGLLLMHAVETKFDADLMAERISQLGGDTAPAVQQETADDKVVDGNDAAPQIRRVLHEVLAARNAYRDMASALSEFDPVSARLLRRCAWNKQAYLDELEAAKPTLF